MYSQPASYDIRLHTNVCKCHGCICTVFRGTVIGIDLGTTCSCAAYLEEGKTYAPTKATPHVIEASRATPSMVAFNGDDKLVGEPAKEQVNPHAHHMIIYRESL